MLRVAHVTRHSCIRVFKEAFALAQREDIDIELHLLTNVLTFGYNIFDSVNVYNDDDMLRKGVRHLSKMVDIFHCHNEPDDLVRMVREETSKPIIYDCHDLESMRWEQEPDEDERLAFEIAAGIVHVSEPCRISAESYHGAEKPTLTLPNFANKIFYDALPSVSYSSFVYEGGLSTASFVINRKTGKEGKNFRNLVPLVKRVIEEGFGFHLYGTASAIKDHDYEQYGAVVNSSGLAYPVMLKALQPHAFGFVGFGESWPLLEAALPNKLFEYISQGVIPVCYKANEAAKLVEELGIGYRIESFDNLKDQLADAEERRAALLALRESLQMENYIHLLASLYEEVLR